MTCAVIGDSIAIDVAAAFHGRCEVNAKIGIASNAIIGRVISADVTVISAGSNDPDNPHLADNLRRIRAKISGRAIWLLPIATRPRTLVELVASEHGDQVVAFHPAHDNVHPKHPAEIAKRITL
jgi:hypothetical protein